MNLQIKGVQNWKREPLKKSQDHNLYDFCMSDSMDGHVDACYKFQAGFKGLQSRQTWLTLMKGNWIRGDLIVELRVLCI